MKNNIKILYKLDLNSLFMLLFENFKGDK